MKGKSTIPKKETITMKKLTKTTTGTLIPARALTTMLAVAVALGISGTARAGDEGQVCGPKTLNGTYVFDAHGFNIVNGVSVPKAILQGLDFNGDGTAVVPFVTVSINGIILRASGTTATYTVAENCTGTFTTADGALYDTYVRPNGKQLFMIQTAGPGGALVVFEGMGVKVGQ